MAFLKPRLPEVLDRGIVIGIVEAEAEEAEKWVCYLTDVTKMQVDWRYGTYEKMKLPHIMFLGSELERRGAIGKLERYAYRLTGKLLAVACDHAKTQLRPPLKATQAELDLDTTVFDCTHAAYKGPTVHNWWCPSCGELMFDTSC